VQASADQPEVVLLCDGALKFMATLAPHGRRDIPLGAWPFRARWPSSASCAARWTWARRRNRGITRAVVHAQNRLLEAVMHRRARHR
jgi:hypothetical protein